MICPSCKRAFTPSTADSKTSSAPDHKNIPTGPFCSARCRAADLGSWLNGNYRIVTPGSDDELDSGPDSDGDNVN